MKAKFAITKYVYTISIIVHCDLNYVSGAAVCLFNIHDNFQLCGFFSQHF
jgi:hypothetical protein